MGTQPEVDSSVASTKKAAEGLEVLMLPPSKEDSMEEQIMQVSNL